MTDYELERAAAAACLADYELYGDSDYLKQARFHLEQARKIELAQSPSI